MDFQKISGLHRFVFRKMDWGKGNKPGGDKIIIVGFWPEEAVAVSPRRDGLALNSPIPLWYKILSVESCVRQSVLCHRWGG